MSQVDKIHWFPNHGPVNSSPLLLLFREDRGVRSEAPFSTHSGRREGNRVLETTRGRAKDPVDKGM